MAENVIKQSEALDQLAKLILSQTQKKPSGLASIKEEYESKLKKLDELISMITSVELDKGTFEELISKKIEIVEKDGQEYAMIPVRKRKKAKSSHKRNNIECSYCHEKGHLRSKCQKKLLGIPP